MEGRRKLISEIDWIGLDWTSAEVGSRLGGCAGLGRELGTSDTTLSLYWIVCSSPPPPPPTTSNGINCSIAKSISSMASSPLSDPVFDQYG